MLDFPIRSFAGLPLRHSDGVPVKMSAADYSSRFPAINVRFNWQRFGESHWPVHRYVVEDRKTLLNLTTALRLRFGRQPRILKPIGSHFMSIAEMVATVPQMSDMRRSIIDKYVEQFWVQDHVELEVPTYRLPHNRQMLLDGNHRLTALATVDVPFRLTLFSVKGPWLYIPR